ncbi:MAG: endoglucanase, partial [Armatimonadetes bacterium]|nr:endoglucanase [Armatimonadota bacterium]NIO97943.1 endoglucanase [Armatimonadota bacterium]
MQNVINDNANCPDTISPSMPQDLSATAVSCSQVSLTWSASADTGGSGLAGYKVYRNGAFLKQVAGTSTTDSGLSASATYSYRVSAIDNAGNESAQGSTAVTNTPQCPDITPPSVPSGLSAAAVSSFEISLTWNPSTDTGGSGLAGYRVYRDGAFITTTTATS